MTTFLLLWLAFADIAATKSEPDPLRRSELAIANADRAVDAARQAYSSADVSAERGALAEIRESVELCYDSLHQTNETPRRSKYYKRSEQKVQALVRRLNTLRNDVDVEDRGAVETVIKRLEEIHDQLLVEIMSKKRK